MSRLRRRSSLFHDGREAAVGSARVRFTPLMQKRLTGRAQQMIERSLAYFPELSGRIVTVGYTRVHLGTAVLSRRHDDQWKLVIRLKVRHLTYQTIGHELTHLVQALSADNRSHSHDRIPTGEAQCDIWTLARHELFCDDPPTYIKLPKIIRELWPYYAVAVRKLCVAAIRKRPGLRPYIRWLEGEIAALARTRLPERITPAQLTLPFVT